jgi:ribosomal protein L11
MDKSNGSIGSSLMECLLGKGNSGLLEKSAEGALKVEKQIMEKRNRSIKLSEGKVPDYRKDKEETVIKKLTEKDEEEEAIEQEVDMEKEDELAHEELDTEKDIVKTRDAMDKEKEAEGESTGKAFLGKKADNFYYLVIGEGDEKYQVTDQEGKVAFAAEDAQLENDDPLTFLIAAVKELQLEDISYDIFMKYVVPAFEKIQKEEEEEGEKPIESDEGDEELPPEEDEIENAEDEQPIESKKVLKEVKVTFDRREFNINLIDEAESKDTVVEINGKRFNFSPGFSKMYKDTSGKISEDKLKELALSALSNMAKEDFEALSVKVEEKRAMPMCKKCGKKHWPMNPCKSAGKKDDKKKDMKKVKESLSPEVGKLLKQAQAITNKEKQTNADIAELGRISAEMTKQIEKEKEDRV